MPALKSRALKDSALHSLHILHATKQTRGYTHSNLTKGCIAAAHDGSLYTMSQKKTVQISFCQNFVKFPPILAIFGRKMAKGLQLREVHSFYHLT